MFSDPQRVEILPEVAYIPHLGFDKKKKLRKRMLKRISREKAGVLHKNKMEECDFKSYFTPFCDSSVKVSKFQKQNILLSILPKNERKTSILGF